VFSATDFVDDAGLSISSRNCTE